MATSASADVIYFSFFPDFGVPPASGAPTAGFYNVEFRETPGTPGAVHGAIERAGTVIASAPAAPPSSGINGASVLEATLQPGDVARLSDPNAGSSLTATVSGYPTVNAQCGTTTVTGATEPGQPAVYARYDTAGFGSPGEVGAVTNANGGYTATFARPLPTGAVVYVFSEYTQPQPLLEVRTEVQARALGTCPTIPLPKPASHLKPATKCAKSRRRFSRSHKPHARHCRRGKAHR